MLRILHSLFPVIRKPWLCKGSFVQAWLLALAPVLWQSHGLGGQGRRSRGQLAIKLVAARAWLTGQTGMVVVFMQEAEDFSSSTFPQGLC